MPQLNPSPWFAILIFSWLVLLLVVLPKINSYTFPKEPTSQTTQTLEPTPWSWPW